MTTQLDLQDLLEKTAVLHKHLCPRQVLGVRMGLYAGDVLGLELPQSSKRLLTIMETDGCGADGVSVATNCWVGRRTMRIEDYGKMAATFVDVRTETAVRIAPHPNCRHTAQQYAPEAKNKWQGYLLGYQRMPAADLFTYQPVHLRQPIADIIGRPGKYNTCVKCGEEILNQREVRQGDLILCRGCTAVAYYTLCEQATSQNPQQTLPE